LCSPRRAIAQARSATHNERARLPEPKPPRLIMSDLLFRRATRDDLPAIVALLADDILGRQRESTRLPLDPRYLAAFDAIDADPNQQLIVAISADAVVGTLQLTFIPGIARLGAWRGQVEAVRIASSQRGAGLGEQLLEWAIDACRTRGCDVVQLTTDKQRHDAHRFYERLGFVASHAGYKLALHQ
jgi:GNAT superfamily N-acetyltransferase